MQFANEMASLRARVDAVEQEMPALVHAQVAVAKEELKDELWGMLDQKLKDVIEERDRLLVSKQEQFMHTFMGQEVKGKRLYDGEGEGECEAKRQACKGAFEQSMLHLYEKYGKMDPEKDDVVDLKDMDIIEDNGRLRAARAMGWEKDVTDDDITESETSETESTEDD